MDNDIEEKKLNMKNIIDKIKDDKLIEINVLINHFIDRDLDRSFVYEFIPKLPIEGDADTLEEAQNQSVNAIKFLLKEELSNLDIEFILDELKFNFTVNY